MITVAELKAKRRELREKHAKQMAYLDVQIAVVGKDERLMLPRDDGKTWRQVIHWRGQGSSWLEICTELNSRGVKNPKGKMWTSASLERWFNLRGEI